MKVEITSENLIGTLSGEYHLDAYGLYHPRQEIHRCGGAYGSDVVGLYVVYDIAYGVESLLNSVVYLVVNSTYIIGNKTSLSEVGCALESYGKGVQSRPVGTCLGVVLDTLFAELLGYGGNYRRVQASRQQHSIGNIAHKLSFNGSRQCISHSLNTGGVVLDGIVVEPITTIITFHPRLATPVIVTWQKRLIAFTFALEGFQF